LTEANEIIALDTPIDARMLIERTYEFRFLSNRYKESVAVIEAMTVKQSL
jgi:hypothetical protein